MQFSFLPVKQQIIIKIILTKSHLKQFEAKSTEMKNERK